MTLHKRQRRPGRGGVGNNHRGFKATRKVYHDVPPERLGDVLYTLIRDGLAFVMVLKGDSKKRFVAAKYLRDAAKNPRVEMMWAAPSLLRQHPDLFAEVTQ